ncbi:hypothetical protein [Enterovirga sp. CN4-39]|uniref:hypothetical protein n=1 Tax=Enterovirga sp. CN4-39 TaxID=3400910 RepID=UPI003C008425
MAETSRLTVPVMICGSPTREGRARFGAASLRLFLVLLTLAALLSYAPTHVSAQEVGAGSVLTLEDLGADPERSEAHCHCMKTSRLPEQAESHARRVTYAAFGSGSDRLDAGRTVSPPLKPPQA